MGNGRSILENRLSVYTKQWLEFIEKLRSEEVDVLLFDSRPNSQGRLVPGAIQYVSRDHLHRFYDTHLWEAWPADLQMVIEGMTGIVRDEADMRDIPASEGHIMIEENYSGGDSHWIYFDAKKDLEGKRTKRAFETWSRVVSSLSPPKIEYETSSLNYVRDPVGSDDECESIKGYYSIRTPMADRKSYVFFADTIPTAKWLLGKKVSVPLNSEDTGELSEKILKLLNPLQAKGRLITARV